MVGFVSSCDMRMERWRTRCAWLLSGSIFYDPYFFFICRLWVPKSQVVAQRSFDSERMARKWRYNKQFRAIRDLNQ